MSCRSGATDGQVNLERPFGAYICLAPVGWAANGFSVRGPRCARILLGRRETAWSAEKAHCGRRPPTATEMGGGSVHTFSIRQLTLRIAVFASREKERKGQRKQQRTEGFDSLISSPSFDATACVRTVITRATNKQASLKKEQRKACLVPLLSWHVYYLTKPKQVHR